MICRISSFARIVMMAIPVAQPAKEAARWSLVLTVAVTAIGTIPTPRSCANATAAKVRERSTQTPVTGVAVRELFFVIPAMEQAGCLRTTA